MAGTINVSSVTDGTYAFTPEQVKKGVSNAWVNFNGIGIVTIRDSYNVSSITDNGTGDYTVNFTSPLPSANYACVAGGIGSADPITGLTSFGVGARTISNVRISTTNSTSGRADFQNVDVVAFSS